MAHEVHEGLGQLLTALKIDIDLLPRRIAGAAGGDAARSLQQRLQMMSQLALTMIHSVRRIAAELRPSMLDDLGLAAAIHWQLREFEKGCGVRCTFTCEPEAATVEPAGATTLFRIAEEALRNVAQHARATCVTIALGTQAGQTVLEVRDDGRGISDADLRSPGSLGLLAMRERARVLGGTVDIHGASGRGTTVCVRVPRHRSNDPSAAAGI